MDATRSGQMLATIRMVREQAQYLHSHRYTPEEAVDICRHLNDKEDVKLTPRNVEKLVKGVYDVLDGRDARSNG